MLFNKVAIIGLGLIGGSMGMAITHRRIAKEVIGVDLNERILKEAQEVKAIDRGTIDIKGAVAEAELIIMAVPIGAIIPTIKAITPYLGPNTIITDAGSTKGHMVEQIEGLLPEAVYYVGGHPMAGSEKGGIQAADRYLLENAYYIITPTGNTEALAKSKVMGLVEAIGAKPVEMDPHTHDMVVAGVSHLPHLVATTLVNSVANLKLDIDPLSLAAGGFRDTTRVAAGDALLWRDILLSNRESILTTIGQFKVELEKLEDSLKEMDDSKLVELLDEAKQVRESIPKKIRGILPNIYEVVVTVPDKPGVIGELAQILGNEQVNIMDIEILRIREGEGGTIKLGFQSEELSDKAFAVLRKNNIIVNKR